MYISKLKLTHMRCYEEVIIDLEKEDTPFSLMLAGNNGSGKSAILRSIAMGLCDQASAGSLLRELLGDFIRKDVNKTDRESTITINLKDKDDDGKTKNYEIKTIIETNKNLGFEVVSQKINKGYKQKTFPWDKIFVTAYGAGLRTEGTEDYGQYFYGYMYMYGYMDRKIKISNLNCNSKRSRIQEEYSIFLTYFRFI